MKKIVIALVISILVIILCTNLAFASGNIVETPDIKVVIEGKLTTYKNVPLVVDDSTMLPLREILNNLGVQDSQISWNESEQSVTVNKDGKKIYLKVNSLEAKIDGNTETLKVAPLQYKDRVYIPVRFVSQVLGKKVVWDGSTTTVLIRELSEYNKIDELLKKSDAAMNAVNKVAFKIDVGMKMASSDFSMNFGLGASGKTDKKNKAMYMDMNIDFFGMNMKTESYMVNNAQYTKNPLTGKWEKETVSKLEYDEKFEKSDTSNIWKANEALSCGLVQSESSNPNEIVLKGNVFFDELYNKANQNTGDKQGFDIDSFYMEAYLDKNTSRVNKIIMKLTGKSEEEIKSSASMDLSLVYSDYEGSFEVKVPDEILKNAVDAKADNDFELE